VSATRPERATAEMQGWCSRYMSADTLEEFILEVFRQILKNPGVTPESDFFEFGGDSNSAIDAVFQISDHTGVDVDMTAIFTYPTPRELSAALAGALENS
jgi:acyl carrier protein